VDLIRPDRSLTHHHTETQRKSGKPDDILTRYIQLSSVPGQKNNGDRTNQAMIARWNRNFS
jgi:hypothetical protein